MKDSVENGLLTAAEELNNSEITMVGLADHWALYKDNKLIDWYEKIDGNDISTTFNALSKKYGFCINSIHTEPGNDLLFEYFDNHGEFPKVLDEKFIK